MKRVSKPQATFAVTGFKKAFTRERFVEFLEGAQMKVAILESDKKLKGHVAVCKNL
jgi:hypothetical protein